MPMRIEIEEEAHQGCQGPEEATADPANLKRVLAAVEVEAERRRGDDEASEAVAAAGMDFRDVLCVPPSALECQVKRAAGALRRAWATIQAERRRKQEAEAAAEVERLEEARRLTKRREEAEAVARMERVHKAIRSIKNREQQRKKDEVAALVGGVLSVDKNGTNALYDVLGVAPGASAAEVKKAYRKLVLRLHPDKDRYATADIDKAFEAVADAYETLKDDARRGEYDLLQNRNSAAPAPEPAATSDPPSFGVLPAGAGVTVQSNYDARFPHLVGMKGSILHFDPLSNLYTVKLDNAAVIRSPASALFQNAIVCLRARMASQLGAFLVTLASHWSEAGSYQASYRPGDGGVKRTTTLRPEQFIVPCGTAVRLPARGDACYGTVVDWREGADDRGNDASYYEVRLSSTVSVRANMAEVCL